VSDPLLSGHGGVQRWPLLRPALTHAFTAVLAMGVASSLPAGANFILFRWWPRVADDANLLMLLNPASESAQRRVDSLPDGITLRSFAMEIDASIAYLANLRALGRKVTVKFYEREPFWKVAVLGDHVWVQYCHGGFEVKHEPEYVFALNRASPRRGFFVPFYMHFLDQWNDASHPEFDFDTNELVYPDAGGGEARRQAFVGTAALPEAAPLSPPRTAWEYRR
jgi:hypothetical protein